MLKVYNTMTRSKEEFKPLKDGEVSIYCCGVTPYNHPHIGNAHPFVTWDVIRRYLPARVIKYIIFKILLMLMTRLLIQLIKKA